MKIVIENTTFPYNEGVRLLKLKHESSPFEQLNEIWDEIKPLTFREIAELENLEQRRVGMLCLGIDRLVSEVNPELLSSRTLNKETTYIDRNGKLVREKFADTYELYKVEGKKFGTDQWGRSMGNCYFVKFKDTSTDRKYMIWVEASSVFDTNKKDRYDYYREAKQIDPIQCIAWTIQTNVQEGNIKEILRQGDCVLVKPKDPSVPLLESPRHLKETEYIKYLVAES